jgi:hypothetical protein
VDRRDEQAAAIADPVVRRSRLVVAALAALLALPAGASAKANLQVGFLDNAYASLDPQGYWADSKALHVGFARWDMQWAEIAVTQPREPRNPEDPAYFWAHSDAFVRQAAEHGLQDRVMFTLWKTPRWASSTGATRARATQMPRLKAWRDFVFACAKRYSGRYVPPGQTTPLPRVVAWETWNEPNAYFAFRPQWQNGVPVSPRNYVQLLKALRYEVGRAVPFKPTFVAGAMYKQGGRSSLTPLQFMEGMRRAGARFDVLSMHPYNRVPADGIRDGANESSTSPYSISVGNFESFIAAANRIFGRRYPIWITGAGRRARDVVPRPGRVRAAGDREAEAAAAGRARRVVPDQGRPTAQRPLVHDRPAPFIGRQEAVLQRVGVGSREAEEVPDPLIRAYFTPGRNQHERCDFRPGVKSARS